MAILNYTTTIDAYKTISEIEYILQRHGARSILKEFSADSKIVTGMSFIVSAGPAQIPIKLPVHTERVLEILRKEKREHPRTNIKVTAEQAERVGWRIIKDWVEAQMALLEIDLVKMEEIFLPYIVTGADGKTIFEKLEQRQFLLEG